MSIVSVINIKYQTGRTGFSSFWLEIHEVCSPDVSFRDLLPVSPSLEMLISRVLPSAYPWNFTHAGATAT